MSRFFKFLVLLWMLAYVVGAGFREVRAETPPGNSTVKVGLLAYRGLEIANTRWRPLIDYLSVALGEWNFELVPVTLASASGDIVSKKIHFLITNPGHYISLSEDHSLSALATRERRQEGSDRGLLRYGSVIFVRSSSDINALGDLKGKRLAAVSPEAFGGFQIAWQEFKRQSIDPFKDLEKIVFMGFPQDAIITSVHAGDVDAGIVRSGLLEQLAHEGTIDIRDFRVLQANTLPAYPYLISTNLYSEWCFASLPSTDKRLREKVLEALLATQNQSIVKKFGLRDAWSAPLSYRDARRLIREYNNRNDSAATVSASFVADTWFLILPLGLFALLVVVFAGMVFTRRLDQSAKGVTEDKAEPVTPDIEEAQARFDGLTRRETQILSLICYGQSSKEMAEELGISPRTVDYHRANLLRKTQAGTTPHLVQLATRVALDHVVLPGSPK